MTGSSEMCGADVNACVDEEELGGGEDVDRVEVTSKKNVDNGKF